MVTKIDFHGFCDVTSVYNSTKKVWLVSGAVRKRQSFYKNENKMTIDCDTNLLSDEKDIPAADHRFSFG